MNIVPEKKCKVCGETKPLTEFYLRSGLDGNQLSDYYTKCKTCHIAHGKGTRKSKEIAGERGEQLVIDKLRSIGIYAAPGKSSEWKRQDVVAWGCVRLEVKHSRKNTEGYSFGFENQIRGGGIQSHLVVLVCEDADKFSFHVFRAEHPVFYRKRQELKTSVSYVPDPNRRGYGAYGQSLSLSLMEDHRDKWGLIEEVKQEIIMKLLQNEQL